MIFCVKSCVCGETSIELDYIRNLYQSIPDRLDNVIKMKGHLTKY